MGDRLEQSPDGLAPVPSSASELVDQLGRGPRRFTPLVPLGQGGEGMVVVEREASRQPTTDAERVNVSMLSRDGRWHGCQVPSRPLDYTQVAHTKFLRANRWLRWEVVNRREILWPKPLVDIVVLNRDEVRPLVLVIQEPGQPRGLGDWRRGGVRLQFLSELLLQPFYVFTFEPCGAPEEMETTGR